MIYAALSVFLLGTVFLALGAYRLWAGLIAPKWLNWLLLPGTLVAEMAYIFGSLITGGEVRRAKLMDSGSGKGGGASGSEPATEAAHKLGFFGPIVAALMTIVACGGCILLIHSLLGHPVIDQFAYGPAQPAPAGARQAAGAAPVFVLAPAAQLPRTLPQSTGAFWDQVKHQVDLLGRMAGTWFELDWRNWRVPLFVYLAICLSIRLAPVSRPLRPALLAIIIAAGVIALIGLVWKDLERWLSDLWPLVSYVWALLLFLLATTLLIRAAIGLGRTLAGKDRAAKPAVSGEK